jgi:predicted RNA-binding Zn ribbon-like protein
MMAKSVAQFPLLGEPLAVDLVNTVVGSTDGGVDLLASADGLAAWLDAEAARLPIDRTALEVPPLDAVRPLREALRVLFRAAMQGTAPDPAALATVNAASAAAATYPTLDWDAAGSRRVRIAYRAAAQLDILLATIARSAIELLASPDAERLRACGGPGCVLLFVARNPRRRWCAEALCGNRVRVARHYRRHH